MPKLMAAGIALLGASLSAGQVCADEGDDAEALVPAVVVVGALDLGLAITDVVAAMKRRPPSQSHDVVEIVLTVPQAALYAVLAGRDGALHGAGLAWGVAALWNVCLAGHGVFELLAIPTSPPLPDGAATATHTETGLAPRWALAPTAFDLGTRAPTPGLAFGGSF